MDQVKQRLIRAMWMALAVIFLIENWLWDHVRDGLRALAHLIGLDPLPVLVAEGLVADHALGHQPGEGLVDADIAAALQRTHEEARVEQVQHRVLDAADVLVDRHPVVDGSPCESFLRVLRVAEAREVPRTLEEGVDVPDADLAIIVAASKQRRQMVQRMGRVMRRKADGRDARFIMLFVNDTDEDPKTGAHELFVSELLAVARESGIFSLPAQEEDLREFVRPDRW